MGKVVLIVEDNYLFRRGLERLLAAEGYEPHAFASAEDAVAGLAGFSFDIALLDIRLPGMNGDELAELLNKRCAYKPIAFVSSEFGQNSQLQRRIPGCQILAKPIQVPELLGMLRRMTRMESLPNRYSPLQ